MTSIERQQCIIEQIRRDGRVRVAALSERIGVSAVTIRQDLSALQERGLLMRVRGGALPVSVLTRELALSERVHTYSAVKDAIGKRAAHLIQDSDSLLIDSGTTTEALAYNFPDDARVTVLTNGFNIARLLGEQDNVELMMTGGHLRRTSQSFYGPQAETALEHLRFSKMIFGIDGVSTDFGLTTHFGPEATLNRRMLDISQQRILLADSSKFGRYGLHRIGATEVIDILVTDSGIPDKYANYLESAGVELMVVDLPEENEQSSTPSDAPPV